LLPKSLEYAKNAIHKYPDFKWFCANTIFITNKNEIIKCSRGPGWHDFVIENGPIYVFGPTSIFHKELFDETGGFNDELHYTMDTDLWMRFKNNNYKFKELTGISGLLEFINSQKHHIHFPEVQMKTLEKNKF